MSSLYIYIFFGGGGLCFSYACIEFQTEIELIRVRQETLGIAEYFYLKIF